MTRENKLALVVGFGLILLVGILISDHFSVARNQAAAQLTQVIDPLTGSSDEAGDARADLIALRPDAKPAPRIAAPADHGGVRPIPTEVVVGLPDRIEMGGGADLGPAGWSRAEASRSVGLDPRDAQDLPYTIHVVEEGDSLSSICGRRFGDPSLAVELAGYNDLADPDHVRIGQRLRIPPAGVLVRGQSAPAAAPAAAPARVTIREPVRRAAAPRETEAPPRTYTVKEGDVLSEIASRLLGSSRKYLVIYESNRDVLESPDALQAGMTLKIPRDAG